MRILIIEDDPYMADCLGRMFKILAPEYGIEFANNLEQGLEELERVEGVICAGSFPSKPLEKTAGPWIALLNWSQVAFRARELGRPFILFTRLPATVQTFNQVHRDGEANGGWLAAAFAKSLPAQRPGEDLVRLEGLEACETLVGFVRAKVRAAIPCPPPAGEPGVLARA